MTGYWSRRIDSEHQLVYKAEGMDTNQVIDRMLQCTAGQIVACNIVAGVDNGLIDRSLPKEAFDWLGRLAAFRPRYQEPRELVKALVVLRDGDFPTSVKRLAPPPEFRLRGDPRSLHEI